MSVSKGVMSSSKAYVSGACLQALLPETATPAKMPAPPRACRSVSLLTLVTELGYKCSPLLLL